MEIDAHIGCAMSGLTADARTMVDHARVTSQTHAFTYDEKIGVESCTQAVCDLALRFGESVEDDDALMVSCGAPSGCVSKTKNKKAIRGTAWKRGESLVYLQDKLWESEETRMRTHS